MAEETGPLVAEICHSFESLKVNTWVLQIKFVVENCVKMQDNPRAIDALLSIHRTVISSLGLRSDVSHEYPSTLAPSMKDRMRDIAGLVEACRRREALECMKVIVDSIIELQYDDKGLAALSNVLHSVVTAVQQCAHTQPLPL